MVKKELTSSKDYRLLYEQEKEAHLKTKIKLAARRNELHHITKSHSYRLAKGLALSKHALRVAVNHLTALKPFRMYVLWKN